MTDPRHDLSIEVDTQLYSASAAMRAAYKFTDRFHVELQRPSDADELRLTVILRPKGASQIVDARALRGDFLNELLDQRLRETLEAEFGAVRELIVAQAFADTNLLDPAREDSDYIDDRLGIGGDAHQANVESLMRGQGAAARQGSGTQRPLADAGAAPADDAIAIRSQD
jgi:His-Xaa-Ser system protein HxsD